MLGQVLGQRAAITGIAQYEAVSRVAVGTCVHGVAFVECSQTKPVGRLAGSVGTLFPTVSPSALGRAAARKALIQCGLLTLSDS